MGELLLLVIIVTAVVLAIRRGKPAILDNPLVINSEKYHLTLAPQLRDAQNFLERVVGQTEDIAPQAADSVTQCFAVYDEAVCPSGDKLYLLAVALRGGVWYLQAILPQPLLRDSDSHLKTISAFSALVLARHPATDSDPKIAQKIHDAVMAVARTMCIRVVVLTA